nr:hypothetical protein [uncultured Oscillibacter sp.]
MLDEKDLKQIADLMNVIIENQVTPKFNMMAEMLLDLKDEISGDKTAKRLDDTEERLDVHEAVIRRHSAEIEKLKKAQ